MFLINEAINAPAKAHQDPKIITDKTFIRCWIGAAFDPNTGTLK